MRLVLVGLLCAAMVHADDEPTEFQKYFEAHAKQLATVFGAQVCMDRATRAAAEDALEREKKYTKKTGVNDTAKLVEIRKQLRWADEQERKDLRDARAWKTKPAPCTNIVVKLVLDCKVNNSCDDTSRALANFIEAYSPDEE